MASILDAGLIGVFSGVIIFLMVLVLVWGVLRWKKPFGENDGVYAILALAGAIFASMAAPVRQFITMIAPWYIAFAIVLFFAIFLFTLFGIGEKDFITAAKDTRLRNTLIIIIVLIFVAGLGFTFGPGLTPGGGQQVPVQSGVPYQDPGTVGPGGQVPQGGGPVQPGQPGSTATADYGTNLVNTLFHPKVLGIAITFLIATFAIYFLSQGST